MGEWLEGNAPIVGARTHAFWLGSSVFDGARAFEGVTPDLDKHCARLNRSAKAMCLKPTMSVEAMLELAREGMKKFKPGAELYIRPMYWAEHGSLMSSVPPDPDSTRFCLCLYEAPLPQPTGVIDHPLPLRQAARRHHADRSQGRLPLSQQRAGADRGSRARLRQLPHVRHAGQCRGAGDRERVHGQGRRR